MKYYIIKVTGSQNQLLETVDAGNEKAARRQVTPKYVDIITSGTSKLAVVSKTAYEKYYK